MKFMLMATDDEPRLDPGEVDALVARHVAFGDALGAGGTPAVPSSATGASRRPRSSSPAISSSPATAETRRSAGRGG